MQQTVYQHESLITVWRLSLEDSFIVINNKAVSDLLYFPIFSDVTHHLPVLQSGPDQPSRQVLFPL